MKIQLSSFYSKEAEARISIDLYQKACKAAELGLESWTSDSKDDAPLSQTDQITP